MGSSFPTRDQTWALCIGEHGVLATGPPGKSLNALLGLFLAFLIIGAFQVASVVKNPPANAGNIRDAVLIPGSGRSLREGHGNPLQYSYLENISS